MCNLSCYTDFSILTYRRLSPYQMPFIYFLSQPELELGCLSLLSLPAFSPTSQPLFPLSVPLHSYLLPFILAHFSHLSLSGLFSSCLLSIFLPYLSSLSIDFFSHYLLCFLYLLSNFSIFLLYFLPFSLNHCYFFPSLNPSPFSCFFFVSLISLPFLSSYPRLSNPFPCPSLALPIHFMSFCLG